MLALFADFYQFPEKKLKDLNGFSQEMMEMELSYQDNDSEVRQDDIELASGLNQVPNINSEQRVINSISDRSYLFLVAEQGNLSALKTFLDNHKAIDVFAKNTNGHTALYLAANNGHLAVVDHLVRHYYVKAKISDKKQIPQKLSSEHPAVQCYIDYFLHRKTKSYSYDKLQTSITIFTREEQSLIYLIYLWMQVLDGKNNIISIKTTFTPPKMHQLSFDHQKELIFHMIREGHALSDWSIQQNALTISDMTLDKKHIKALAQLLAGDKYELLQMNSQTIIHPNKVYWKLDNNGVLECCVQDSSGQIRTNHIIDHGEIFPLTLEQLIIKPELVQRIVKAVGNSPIINELSFNSIRFINKGYAALLELVGDSLLIPFMHKFSLRDCDLGDGELRLLSPVITKRSTLLHVNLDNNHISFTGLEYLFDALTKRNERNELYAKWRTLSLRFNKIKLNSTEALIDINNRIVTIERLSLEGNMIIEDDLYVSESKRNDKMRINVLVKLFPLLSKEDPKLTIETFLTASNVSIGRCENSTSHFFRLTLRQSSIDIEPRVIEAKLPQWILNDYMKLPIYGLDIDARQDKEQQIFTYLTKRISPMTIPDRLRHTPLPRGSYDNPKQIAICKKLLTYHPHACLKSHLITHSIFGSQKIEQCPSLLFPPKFLTLTQGNVYFISEKKTPHSMLGYEYLTKYGQRVLRIVHLRLDKSLNQMIIKEFSPPTLLQLVNKLHEDYDIAPISVKTEGIKAMRKAIQSDLKNKIVNGKYQTVIFASSYERKVDDDRVQNCVTYCIDLINNHSAMLGVKLKLDALWILKPSSIVFAINNKPNSTVELVESKPHITAELK